MNDIKNGGTLNAALKKDKNQEVPIYRATNKFVTLKILQPISVVWKFLGNI
jgi:hypothetical protein